MVRSSFLPALRIAGIYFITATLWIVLSDQAVDMLVHDRTRYMWVQTWKGWLFVSVTAVLLFQLVHSAMRQLRRELLEQQHLSNELAASRSIQAQMLEALDDVVWMLDLNSGEYLFISNAVESVYGVSTETFRNDPNYWLNCVYEEDRPIAAGKQQRLQENDAVQLKYRIVHTDGKLRWLRDRTRLLRDDQGKPCRLIGIATDITTHYQHAEHIHRLSNYDILTGLPNRMMLIGIMHTAIEDARNKGTRFAVLYMDIARLKDINDTYGHAVGDEVLRRFSGRLRSCVTGQATIARLGADEFAMTLPGLADGALAGIAAQQVLAVLTVPMALSVGEIRIATAVGISLFPVDADTPEALLQHAGLALHDAKSRGVGQLSFYQPSMNAAVAERVELAADLHHALERNELELHYQPQIDLSDGRVVAVEALMRWRHPKRGLVSPAQFIPIAETSGMIVAMGAWALAEACRQNRAWQDAGLPSMVVAVNISALQFRTGNLRDTTAKALLDSGLDAHWLELEVTESVIMDGAEHMLDVLAELRALGVQLSIDDFGTGYSSLSYLTRFAVNKLKIDQAFVHGALLRERDAAIVGIIVQMAKLLHLRVIAEGVETEAQAEMLRHHGCEEAQGYLYARPLPPAALADFLRARSA